MASKSQHAHAESLNLIVYMTSLYTPTRSMTCEYACIRLRACVCPIHQLCSCKATLLLTNTWRVKASTLTQKASTWSFTWRLYACLHATWRMRKRLMRQSKAAAWSAVYLLGEKCRVFVGWFFSAVNPKDFPSICTDFWWGEDFNEFVVL